MRRLLLVFSVSFFLFFGCLTSTELVPLTQEEESEFILRTLEEDILQSYYYFLSAEDSVQRESGMSSAAYLEELRNVRGTGNLSENDSMRYLLALSLLGDFEGSRGLLRKEIPLLIEAALEDGRILEAEALLFRYRNYFFELEEAEREALLEKLKERGRTGILSVLGVDLALPVVREDWLEGTATIIVDRGIVLQEGIGFPDMMVGSGFFIDNRGFLLTNYHVIASEVDPEYEGYSRLYIRRHGKTNEKIPARVVGWDRELDLALIKVEVESDYVLPFAYQQSLQEGDPVYAVGSPGGLDSTLTSGIISAVERRFLPIGYAFQIDAAINPGNSGGPLLNPQGEILGIVFAGIEQFEGINFALSSKWLRPVIDDLYRGGAVVHNWLGLSLSETDEGLEVLYVFPESSAERSGFQKGDTLLRIDGVACSTIPEAQALLLELPRRGLAQVEWEPGDAESREAVLYLAERPDLPLETALEMDSREDLFPPLFGMDMDLISRNFMETRYLVDHVYPGMAADLAGIQAGDEIRLRRWFYDPESQGVFLQMVIRQRKTGFWESGLQLGAYIEANNLL